MKLLDKIKDLFMDEVAEDDEFELEEEQKDIYKEPQNELPTVMRETIKKEEKKEEKINLDELVSKSDAKAMPTSQSQEPSKKFNFPIDFGDEIPERKDRIPTRQENNNHKVIKETEFNLNNTRSNLNVLALEKEKEVKQKMSELYPKKEEVKIKPKFKATPVISPVYGILDKNYRKEEVKERPEDNVNMKRPSKKVDFETVRKKAFGNLADEIKDNLLCENCELYKEVKKISALKEDDLLYDMTVDSEKDVTIEKAYDNYKEFGVAYEPEKHHEELVSSEEAIEEVTEPIINNNVIEEEKITSHDEEVIEKIPSRQEKNANIEDKDKMKKETKVDEDFFELIDSMYKERSDE